MHRVGQLAMKIKPIRTSLQILGLILHNVGFTFSLKTGIVTPALYCYACPLASFACPVGTLQHFCAMRTLPLYVIGSIGLWLTVGGRSFCGCLCPFGALHDAIDSVKSKLGRTRSRRLNPYPATKFLMLFAVLGLAWYTVDTFFCKFCPSASLVASIPYFVLNPVSGIPFYFIVHMLTLASTLLLAVLMSRFWCRYLCPMGAINGMFNRFSILKIARTEECTECKKCLENCPMGINHVDEIGKSSDCIKCGRCIDSCTTQALRFTA